MLSGAKSVSGAVYSSHSEFLWSLISLYWEDGGSVPRIFTHANSGLSLIGCVLLLKSLYLWIICSHLSHRKAQHVVCLYLINRGVCVMREDPILDSSTKTPSFNVVRESDGVE